MRYIGLCYLFIFFFNAIVLNAQNYTDGPIEIQVKLREVGNYYEGDDWSVFGTNINSEPEDFTYKLWFSDNLNILPWIGYGPSGLPIEGTDNIINTQDDLAFNDDIVQVSLSGTNSRDFNSIVSILNYNNNIVPQFLKMKFFGWEDDNPSDPFTSLSWAGVTINNSGFRNIFEPATCQYTLPWWLGGGCAPLAFQGDDYGCEAEPFYTGIDWRYMPSQNIVPPCQFYSHGQINGSGCVNNSNNTPAPNTDSYYKPHIETMWRYTKGTSFNNAIDLGALLPFPGTSHFNSNICYNNNYTASIGNDVIYSFNISNPTGVNISLCGVGGAQFDSHLYLLSESDTINFIESNDNSNCGLQSQITTSLCSAGIYYVVVDAVSYSDTGTFTLTITEDPSSTFMISDSISDYNGQNITCLNENDGKIYVDLVGGTPPFTFSWSNGITNNSMNYSDSITKLIAGTYSVVVTDDKGCQLPSLNVVINEPDSIISNVISTPTTCFGYSDGSAIVSNTIGGSSSYSYFWSTNPIQTGITANGLSAGQYQLTVYDANNCSSSFQVLISEPNEPTISLTSSASLVNNTPLTYEVCNGNNISLSASGLVSYSWSPNIWLNTNLGANVTSTPSSPGITYVCTGIDVNGCPADVSVVIDVVSSINIYADKPNPQVCSGESVEVNLFGANSYSWSPPTYLNTTNGSNVIISPLDTITYTITAQNASGCSDQTTFFVDVLPPPSLFINSSGNTICEGNSVTMTASGANNYFWSPSNSLNSQIGNVVVATPNISTQYKVVGVDNNNCKDSIYSTVNVNPNPVINISGTNTICQGDSTTLIANGASSYVWSPSNSLNLSSGNIVIANPSVTQSYTVIGTDLNQCESTVNYQVSILNNPIISISSTNDTICVGEVVNLSATGAVSYVWSPASSLNVTTGSTVSAMPTMTTNYSVTGISSENCITTLNKSISVNPLPSLSINSNSFIICEDSSISLIAVGAQNYLWSPSVALNINTGSTVIASPTISTIYYVTGTDFNGCCDVLRAQVNVNPKPNITLSPISADICEGASVQIDAFGANDYTWNPISGLNIISPSSVIASSNSSINYTVTGTDVNNCKSTTNFQLNIGIKPDISISSSADVICEGQSITLSANGANQYLWSPSNLLSSPNGSTVTISPSLTTTVYLNGIDSIGCQNNDSITITVNPLPTISFIDDFITICDNDSAAILLSLSGNFPFSLVYSIDQVINDNILEISSNTSFLATSQEGLYEIITLTDINGCVNSSDDEILIDVLNTPIARFDYVINDNNIFQSQVSFINNSQFANNFTWNFGDPPFNGVSYLENPIYTYNEPGYYDVTLVAENGPCVKDTSYELYIKPVFSLYLPNSFTPNGDKLNDYFPWDPCCVKGENFSDFEIFIYNKWGNLVFYSNDKLNTWDGSVDNKAEIYTGNYSYIIKIIDDIGETHTITGNVIMN